VALIERRAGHAGAEIRAGADAAGADVRGGARVAVVARRAVRRVRIRAHAGCRTARTRHVALIERRAGHRVRSGTGARLAGVALRAEAAVGAGGPIVRCRVRADPGAGITRAGDVALVERRAGHRAACGAGARLTCIALRAGVAVTARRAVGFLVGDAQPRSVAGIRVVAGGVGRAAARGSGGGVRARLTEPRRRIARLDAVADVAVARAHRRRAGLARAAAAHVAGGAGAAVATRVGVVGVDAPGSERAGIVGARIAVVAVRRRPGDARATVAGVARGAGVAVAARRSVRLAVGLADSGAVARVGVVAGGVDRAAARRADGSGAAARARARLAAVAHRAGVVVAAGGSVRERRVRARVRPREGKRRRGARRDARERAGDRAHRIQGLAAGLVEGPAMDEARGRGELAAHVRGDLGLGARGVPDPQLVDAADERQLNNAGIGTRDAQHRGVCRSDGARAPDPRRNR